MESFARSGPTPSDSTQFGEYRPCAVGFLSVARASVSPASMAVFGPVRTCIGCRERVAKSELLRVTAGSDADGRPVVVPDPAATRRGRGAHRHPTTAL